MSLSFVIVDDDAVCRRMLQIIIENGGLGEVRGTAAGGADGARTILEERPDIVLIDLLMPDQDGIETMVKLKDDGFDGLFVMISQIENKDMVEQAYRAGIEFFIHKPINRVEVEAVLTKVNKQRKYEQHIMEIKNSLAKFDAPQASPGRKERTVRDVVQPILMDLGIAGEAGSKDIGAIMQNLADRRPDAGFPPLKELYEAVARSCKQEKQEIAKETKAIEQRLRRAVMSAMTNIASIGLTDYSHPKFEYFAPLYFDFQDVRLKMKAIDEEDPNPDKGKVNVKKFLQLLHMDLQEKLKKD